MATTRRGPALTPDEARRLHEEALVIDSQQPGATSGMLFNDNMKAALDEYVREGKLSRAEIAQRLRDMAVQEVQTSADARREYMAVWEKSGVDVASATYAGPISPNIAFETSLKVMTQARAMIDALQDEVRLVLTADDIERAYADGKRGVIFDFQDTTPFGSDLDRIELFRNLGLRVVQLTYNLRNLVGDGCTERYKTGLTYFGLEVVERLNELGMAVDVSHCSQQVGWDAIEASSSPVIVTHSASNGVCYHDRGKDDDLARAIADQGGYFGLAAIGGFLSETTEATLDHFADHVDHLVDVMGIDHVGIGCDKCGPGPRHRVQRPLPRRAGPVRPVAHVQRGPGPKEQAPGVQLVGLPARAQAEPGPPDRRLRPVLRLAQHHPEAGRARLQ